MCCLNPKFEHGYYYYWRYFESMQIYVGLYEHKYRKKTLMRTKYVCKVNTQQHHNYIFELIYVVISTNANLLRCHIIFELNFRRW
jgi:hypothetical protein